MAPWATERWGTDLKIRHYIWLGLAAELVMTRRKKAERGAAGMAAAEPPVAVRTG